MQHVPKRGRFSMIPKRLKAPRPRLVNPPRAVGNRIRFRKKK